MTRQLILLIKVYANPRTKCVYFKEFATRNHAKKAHQTHTSILPLASLIPINNTLIFR